MALSRIPSILCEWVGNMSAIVTEIKPPRCRWLIHPYQMPNRVEVLPECKFLYIVLSKLKFTNIYHPLAYHFFHAGLKGSIVLQCTVDFQSHILFALGTLAVILNAFAYGITSGCPSCSDPQHIRYWSVLLRSSFTWEAPWLICSRTIPQNSLCIHSKCLCRLAVARRLEHTPGIKSGKLRPMWLGAIDYNYLFDILCTSHMLTFQINRVYWADIGAFGIQC